MNGDGIAILLEDHDKHAVASKVFDMGSTKGSISAGKFELVNDGVVEDAESVGLKSIALRRHEEVFNFEVAIGNAC